MNEEYFVASNGDEPLHIFFDKKHAFESKHLYIDSFDKDGNKCISYKFVNNKYTTDF